MVSVYGGMSHERKTKIWTMWQQGDYPSSPWQRGSNENTNGLLRQYFPKDKGMGIYSQSQLDEIANKLNTRPRKTLGFKTPAEVFEQALH